MSLFTKLRDVVAKPLLTSAVTAVNPTAGAIVGSLTSLPRGGTALPGSGAINSISAGGGGIIGTPAAWPTAIGAAAAAGLTGITRIGSILYSKAGRIIGVMVGSRKITPQKAAVLAKKVGMEAAAAALGISIVELAQMVMEDDAKKRRRRQGISSSEVRITKRTMSKLKSINRAISTSCPPRRRAASHHHHCR